MPARAHRRSSRSPQVVPTRRPAALPDSSHSSRHETSAGGVVVRRVGEWPSAALIGRLDKAGRLRWSLPKGHVEPGETTRQAAVREVREETGITGRITASLGSVSYSFTMGGRRIHKRVHHFLMVAESGELSDEDAEVTEVAWVPLPRVPQVLAYAAERRIVHRAVEVLADTA